MTKIIKKGRAITINQKAYIEDLEKNTNLLTFYIENCSNLPAGINYTIIEEKSQKIMKHYEKRYKTDWDNYIVKNYEYKYERNILFIYTKNVEINKKNDY